VGQVLVLLSPVAISDAYFRDLLNRGDYSRHYSDDVAVEVRGMGQTSGNMPPIAARAGRQ
jgi:hypothetical protein